jgi:hypothetical protein
MKVLFNYLVVNFKLFFFYLMDVIPYICHVKQVIVFFNFLNLNPIFSSHFKSITQNPVILNFVAL